MPHSALMACFKRTNSIEAAITITTRLNPVASPPTGVWLALSKIVSVRLAPCDPTTLLISAASMSRATVLSYTSPAIETMMTSSGANEVIV